MLRVILASLAVSCAYAIVCEPDICQRVRCANVTAEDCVGGTIDQTGGFCGCCAACVTSLAEGDSCFSSLLLGVPASARCAEGLVCDPGTLKCAQPAASKRQILLGGQPIQTCAQRRQEILAGSVNGLPLLGQFVPTCESDGTYSAKQCQGSVCYCVDSNGSQIQGYQANIGSSANMDCKCARDQADYMATGMIGRLFTCTSTGSYQRYQCMGSVCFCADEVGNMRLGSPTVNVGNIGSLQC